jgi:hypothetical protein
LYPLQQTITIFIDARPEIFVAVALKLYVFRKLGSVIDKFRVL